MKNLGWKFKALFDFFKLFSCYCHFFCVNMSVAVAAEYIATIAATFASFFFSFCFSLSPNRYFATFPKMLWKQRRLMKQFELATFLAFLRFYPIFAKLCSNELKIRHGENPLWKIISHYVYYWKWRAENFRENTILPPILLYIFRSCWKITRSAFIKLLLIGYSVFSKLGLKNTIELLQLAISLLH